MPLTQAQADVMFSLLSVGAMVGCLSAGTLATHFGPKWSLIANSVPFVAGKAAAGSDMPSVVRPE